MPGSPPCTCWTLATKGVVQYSVCQYTAFSYILSYVCLDISYHSILRHRSFFPYATAVMHYDRSLYALPPSISAPEPLSPLVNVSSQITSGTEQISSHEQLSITPKTENGGAHHIKISARRHHASSAGARVRPGQHPKKGRRRERSPEESNFQGLKPAELESERYLRYRDNARQKAKDNNGQGDDVWPDELENAFQLGKSAGDSLRHY